MSSSYASPGNSSVLEARNRASSYLNQYGGMSPIAPGFAPESDAQNSLGSMGMQNAAIEASMANAAITGMANRQVAEIQAEAAVKASKAQAKAQQQSSMFGAGAGLIGSLAKTFIPFL